MDLFSILIFITLYLWYIRNKMKTTTQPIVQVQDTRMNLFVSPRAELKQASKPIQELPHDQCWWQPWLCPVHHINKIIILIPGPERRTKYGCEGSSLELECEEGTVISLVRANYGRFSISICNGEGNTAWSVNCMEPRTMRVINTR